MPKINQSRRALFVLGMHRSGTSALMRVLNLLGVEMGGSLLAPKKDNPTGFWEQSKLVSIHEDTFKLFGFNWHSADVLPRDWHSHPWVKLHRRKIANILQHDYANKALWGIKDPRLCRLLPLWMPILQAESYFTNFVFIVRNPSEVAASLYKRNGFPPDHAYSLWLRYMLDAVNATEGRPRVVVSYERLLQDWREITNNIAATLDFEWPLQPILAGDKIDVFLQSKLRHHHTDDKSFITDKAVPLPVREGYFAFKQAERGNFGPLKGWSTKMEIKVNDSAELMNAQLDCVQPS